MRRGQDRGIALDDDGAAVALYVLAARCKAIARLATDHLFDAYQTAALSISAGYDLEKALSYKISRRVYLARYASGLSDAKLDAMTSTEVGQHLKAAQRLVAAENGENDGRFEW